MANSRLDDQPVLCFQELDNFLVRIFHVLAVEVRDLFRELAGIVDRTRWHFIRSDDAVGHGDAMIVFTKRWSLMYYARTIILRHIWIEDNPICSVFIL